ncbi:hypothetical protein YTPLAS73_09000 [Nitrosarchaeum sp.]|nr:hypothetical protein YTPLAS73_09000 [Nitrosarchaeum sp.]
MIFILSSEAFAEIYLIILSIILPVVIAWMQSKIKCLDKLDKRTFRIAQALIIMAQDIDKQTNRTHPETNSDLSARVEKILRDSNGNPI